MNPTQTYGNVLPPHAELLAQQLVAVVVGYAVVMAIIAVFTWWFTRAITGAHSTREEYDD